MASEKMREEFEVRYPLPSGCVFHEGKYGFWIVWDESGEPEFSIGMGFTQTKWEVWKESRAALVIELPPMPTAQRTDEEATFSAGGCDMRRKCSKAIEAAGLKVKP